MRERHASRDARRAREFAAFVAGAGGRLLHAATLLTAEAPNRNPRARRLLVTALAHTYAHWDGLRGEDPYELARQQLAIRFARAAWRQHRGHSHWYAQWYTRWYDLWDALWYVLWDARRRGGAAPGISGGSDGRSSDNPEDTSLSERLRRRARPGGVLDQLTPQERLVLVLRMYEGVAEEQTAALLGLPVDRIRTICSRAMSNLLHPPPRRPRSLPKVVPS